MSLTLIPTPEFIKTVKKLSKKYKIISHDLRMLELELLSNQDGSIDLGGGLYKIRVANSSVPVGKSGGFRVIYYKKIANKIYLLYIYSKSDIENIDDKKLTEILKANGLS